MTVDGSTIAGNAGTGVEILHGDAHFFDSTVADNVGVIGGVRSKDGDAVFIHTTVAGNVGTDRDEVVADRAVFGAAIIGDGVGGAPNCRLGNRQINWMVDADDTCPGHGLEPEDPRLGPLEDNGGLTRTRLPSMASPALDRVAWPTYFSYPDYCAGPDQRGLPRPQGFLCDIGSVEVELPDGAPHFDDAGVLHDFFWEIECLFVLGATEGFADGTFRPGITITRQAIVAWLWRLAGEPAPAGDLPFSDVPSTHPFADAIAWAAEEGIVGGFPDGTFRPTAEVSRQALAAWLWRVAGEPAPAGDPPFSDVGPTHPFAAAIAWLAEVGITEGYANGTFRPTEAITRQAVAAWVCRADDLAVV
jgi:hypothetical protein